MIPDNRLVAVSTDGGRTPVAHLRYDLLAAFRTQPDPGLIHSVPLFDTAHSPALRKLARLRDETWGPGFALETALAAYVGSEGVRELVGCLVNTEEGWLPLAQSRADTLGRSLFVVYVEIETSRLQGLRIRPYLEPLVVSFTICPEAEDTDPESESTIVAGRPGLRLVH
jgi:hypothetical protein